MEREACLTGTGANAIVVEEERLLEIAPATTSPGHSCMGAAATRADLEPPSSMSSTPAEGDATRGAVIEAGASQAEGASEGWDAACMDVDLAESDSARPCGADSVAKAPSAFSNPSADDASSLSETSDTARSLHAEEEASTAPSDDEWARTEAPSTWARFATWAALSEPWRARLWLGLEAPLLYSWLRFRVFPTRDELRFTLVYAGAKVRTYRRKLLRRIKQLPAPLTACPKRTPPPMPAQSQAL